MVSLRGHGRTKHLLAIRAFSAQNTASPDVFDWDLDTPTFIALLRQYGRTRDPLPLAALVAIKPFGG